MMLIFSFEYITNIIKLSYDYLAILDSVSNKLATCSLVKA